MKNNEKIHTWICRLQKCWEVITTSFLIAKEYTITISYIIYISYWWMPSNHHDHLVSIQEWRMSLILDTYNDIFSSFDPRDYAEKSFSDDFLDECKKIVIDKWVDVIELRLMIPESQRQEWYEWVIKKRLHSYFLQQSHLTEKRRKYALYHARYLIWLWIGLWFFIAYIVRILPVWTFATVIGEPISWLLLWNWVERLMKFYDWSEWSEDSYVHKLSHAKIHFYGY